MPHIQGIGSVGLVNLGGYVAGTGLESICMSLKSCDRLVPEVLMQRVANDAGIASHEQSQALHKEKARDGQEVCKRHEGSGDMCVVMLLPVTAAAIRQERLPSENGERGSKG